MGALESGLKFLASADQVTFPTEFCDHVADVKPIGWHDQPIPEASDAGTEASYLVDGRAGNTNFPHGNIKACIAILRVIAMS